MAHTKCGAYLLGPSPAYAGSHSCKAVEECAAGVLRSFGEGGHASAGSAEDTKGTTAVKPLGSTRCGLACGTARLGAPGWAGETSGLLISLLALAGQFVTCQCLHSSGLVVASQYLAHLV
jgi:hypothetical protein